MRHRTTAQCVSVMLLCAFALAGLVAVSCGGGDGGGTPDDSAELPGTFVPAQGKGHFNRTFNPDREPLPFCDGVATADEDGAASVAVPTPAASDEQNECYSSNPPSSGWHLGVQRNVEIQPGISINIPPDPDVYPADIEIPREAVPHILEHAGVFVGYHCAEGDAACADVVEQLEGIVNDRIDNNDNRVVMARDSDLPVGTIGLASWTRVDTFPHAGFTEARVVDFIGTHSCRVDAEGFC
jgi:hypothetical protein